jgi:hypothetical protein
LAPLLFYSGCVTLTIRDGPLGKRRLPLHSTAMDGLTKMRLLVHILYNEQGIRNITLSLSFFSPRRKTCGIDCESLAPGSEGFPQPPLALLAELPRALPFCECSGRLHKTRKTSPRSSAEGCMAVPFRG